MKKTWSGRRRLGKSPKLLSKLLLPPPPLTTTTTLQHAGREYLVYAALGSLYYFYNITRGTKLQPVAEAAGEQLSSFNNKKVL